MVWTTRALVTCAVFALAGCATSPLERSQVYEAQGEWLQAVTEYRAAYEQDPGDVELRSGLRQIELRAAEACYHEGLRFLARNDVDSAIASFEQGLGAMPQHEKLRAVLEDAIARKQAEQLYRRAVRQMEIRNYRKAADLLEQALQLAPGFEAASGDLTKVRGLLKKSAGKELALSSDEPIDLNFKQTDLRTAFSFLANAFGINVTFDEAVRDKSVTLYAKSVSFRQALNLMLSTTRTFYKKVGDNTILIASDTREKRGQYEDYIIRGFQLTNATAKEVADILKGVMTLQKVVVDERLNVLTIRDTEEALALAERVIANADAKPAELILEVEILEVNRTKTEQLGFDYGSVITATFPEFTISGSIKDAIDAGTVALPSVTFRYFKQNVDAKTLANPKIRVVNGKPARIHIGDRVPLRSSTIQDATGQTRTTFEYTDIGIRLIVEPQVNLDNSTLVKMGLEVSSLGQNLGTEAEPAFSIGTRNAETVMLLNDGETAILGGLIRDEDRKSRIKVPGLGDIPVVGMLFTTKNDSTTRTDVLLTITPRVIRPWHVPAPDTQTIYSGTAETYSVASRLEDRGLNASKGDRRVGPALPTLLGYSPTFEFRHPVYEGRADADEVSVDLMGRNLREDGLVPLTIKFEEDMVEFLDFIPEPGVEVSSVQQPEAGQVKLAVRFKGAASGTPIRLGEVKFRPTDDGVAHLILGGTVVRYESGDLLEATVHNARFVLD